MPPAMATARVGLAGPADQRPSPTRQRRLPPPRPESNLLLKHDGSAPTAGVGQDGLGDLAHV